MKKIIYLFLFLLIFNKASYGLENSTNNCKTINFDLENNEFFIEIEGFSAKPVKKESITFLGNIVIEKRIYKNSNKKLKVSLYRGKNLINNWKLLLFSLSGFSEESLKDLEIENFKAKVYEKENYKAVILPLLESENMGLVIIFSSETLTLEEMIDLIKKFPIQKFYLSSCS
ncbi:hypothetical protein TOPB45_1437 [Thermodesulfobacterium geofontis OPF15]|jgi:hypothetical protein|uniref:Uncharacterized protein n=1 Tax=Thermodesulfobacterium geofontis (strain OPF15) TaxID=795359 RepID=F8C326_THEGP|nr:hypothetical protein [Thermodesulfobacterium geofontis]AEH23517.1 hypothetical protein TOPB45_1437 [Thermodesulfobacterium geofontis OPF15]